MPNNTITINDLSEIQSVTDSHYLAVDSGTATAKITVGHFNATATASAQAYATAASESATAAAASELAAKGYKEATESAINDASTIVSNAQTYANAAESSKNDASGYASAASTSASQAATSAGQAASYATGVQAYAIEAKSWAEGGTGTRVDEETTNCEYYANAAHTSETNAAASESNASTSETNAAASESNASASASSASTNALKAEGYAVGSQNGTPAESGETYYHDNAKYYKEQAASSETNAAASEYNAGLSETAAAASATAAGESEDDSEAWAWGKVDGVDVPASHPAYHNNAKYWADAASGAAGGGVTSFNGRNGIVVPAASDYSASLVDFDNSTNGFTATDTQAAIEEVQTNLTTLSSGLGTAAVKDSTSSVTQSSTDLVESGAVYTALSSKADTSSLGTAAAKDSTDTISSGSTDLIEGGAVYTALSGKADTSSLGTAAAKDSTNAVTQNSTDLVESGAVYSVTSKAYLTDDTTETALASDDVIPFYDTSATAQRKMTVANVVGQTVSNPNLLDNPWFTVNQRGQSSYSGASTPTVFVDRWKMNDNMSCVVNADKTLTFTNSDTTNQKYFCNRFEHGSIEGKTVTLSILLSDNTIFTQTDIFPTTTNTARDKTIDEGGIAKLRLQNIADFNQVVIFVSPNSNVTVKAVKLELGSVSTLAMDTAPNYATELLKCQRYFYRFRGDTATSVTLLGYAITANGARFPLPMPVPMRAFPTVTVSDLSHWGFSKSNTASAISPTSISLAARRGHILILELVKTSSMTAETVYILCQLNASGYIDFSADL